MSQTIRCNIDAPEHISPNCLQEFRVILLMAASHDRNCAMVDFLGTDFVGAAGADTVGKRGAVLGSVHGTKGATANGCEESGGRATDQRIAGTLAGVDTRDSGHGKTGIALLAASVTVWFRRHFRNRRSGDRTDSGQRRRIDDSQLQARIIGMADTLEMEAAELRKAAEPLIDFAEHSRRNDESD